MDLAGQVTIVDCSTNPKCAGSKLDADRCTVDCDVILAAGESLSKSRPILQVPTQDAALQTLKMLLGIKGRPKKMKDEDEEDVPKPQARHAESDDESEEEESDEEDLEESSERAVDSDEDS